MQLREQGASSAAADRLLHWARHDALVASTAYPRQVEIEVTLLSWIGLAALPTAALLNACILLLIGRWLMRAPWGEDVSWSDGAWRPTDQSGTAPGLRADAGQAIREPGGSRTATLFWTVMFAGMTLAWIALVPHGSWRSPDAILPAITLRAALRPLAQAQRHAAVDPIRAGTARCRATRHIALQRRSRARVRLRGISVPCARRGAARPGKLPEP